MARATGTALVAAAAALVAVTRVEGGDDGAAPDVRHYDIEVSVSYTHLTLPTILRV